MDVGPEFHMSKPEQEVYQALTPRFFRNQTVIQTHGAHTIFEGPEFAARLRTLRRRQVAVYMHRGLTLQVPDYAGTAALRHFPPPEAVDQPGSNSRTNRQMRILDLLAAMDHRVADMSHPKNPY